MEKEQAIEILKFIKGELGVMLYGEGQHGITTYTIESLREVIAMLEAKTP
jgi:uncharacterized protein (DUF2164 family)